VIAPFNSPMTGIREVIHDLVADVRAAERHAAAEPPLRRHALLNYAAKCRAQVRAVYRNRRTAKLDRFGWPSGILGGSK
jgi:hypothetical protein